MDNEKLVCEECDENYAKVIKRIWKSVDIEDMATSEIIYQGGLEEDEYAHLCCECAEIDGKDEPVEEEELDPEYIRQLQAEGCVGGDDE